MEPVTPSELLLRMAVLVGLSANRDRLSGHNPLGWLALAAPACMYWVLVHVSGIPPLEEHMLRSRGAQFRALQARIRPFFPSPKPRPDIRPLAWWSARSPLSQRSRRAAFPNRIDQVSCVVQFRSVAWFVRS